MYFLSEEEIIKKVKKRKVKISVIGLGRMGLPLAVTLADCGFDTLGIDINEELVKKINEGTSPFEDEKGLDNLLSKNVEEGRMVATLDFEERDLNIVIVPTTIRGEEPNIDAIYAVAGEIIKPGDKVFVLESTIPPLTTEKFGEIIAENTGYKAGEDFGLAYSPERSQSPEMLEDLRKYPKIVGGADEKSGFIVSEIYSCFAPQIIHMNSPLVAEIDKVMENTYRDINIAFANELARICEIYGVDVYDVINGANSQPYCNIFNPGLVGGHCIPMDPYYIINDVERKGYTANLIKEARRINESMVNHVAGMVEGEKVVILGLSFKPDIKAFEHSHTLKLIDALRLRSHEIVVHDPFLEDEEFDFKVERDLYEAVEDVDCIILSTAHSAYGKINWSKVKNRMKGNLVVDVRGYFDSEMIKEKGLRYNGIGRIYHLE